MHVFWEYIVCGIKLCVIIDSERQLNIDGEGLNGVYSSRNFVNWYNGHPYYVDAIDRGCFKGDTAVIIGNGNVSIDCARILGSGIDRLSSTDITEHSLNILKNYNNIRQIYVVGRRACHHGSFTNKELREVIDKIPNCISTVMNDDIIHSKNEDIVEMKVCMDVYFWNESALNWKLMNHIGKSEWTKDKYIGKSSDKRKHGFEFN